MGWDLRFSISDKLTGKAAAAGLVGHTGVGRLRDELDLALGGGESRAPKEEVPSLARVFLAFTFLIPFTWGPPHHRGWLMSLGFCQMVKQRVASPLGSERKFPPWL